jgi:hypothetical protein
VTAGASLIQINAALARFRDKNYRWTIWQEWLVPRELIYRLLFAMILAAACGSVAAAQSAVDLARGPWGGAASELTRGAAPVTMASPYGMMGGYWDTEAYLAALKTQLAIAPAQEQAWDDYTDLISGVGRQVALLDHIMFESMAVASWPKRQVLMHQTSQARQQVLDTVHEAAVNLVAALDLAQKDKARLVLPGLGYRHRAPGLR